MLSKSTLNVSGFCMYLLSELEADPPHISLLGTPARNQSDHFLLGSKGTILATTFCLTAFLRQRNLLLTQEVGIPISRGYDLTGGGAGGCFTWHDADREAKASKATSKKKNWPCPVAVWQWSARSHWTQWRAPDQELRTPSPCVAGMHASPRSWTADRESDVIITVYFSD